MRISKLLLALVAVVSITAIIQFLDRRSESSIPDEFKYCTI